MLFSEKFEEFLIYLEKMGRDPKTVKEYRRFLFGALSHSVENIKLKNLKLTDVSKIIEAGRAHGAHGPTRAVLTLRRYLKFLKDSGEKVPFDWRDPQLPRAPEKEQPVLEEGELAELLDSLDWTEGRTATRRNAFTARVLFEVLFATGARISEALALRREQWEDIKNQKETVIKGGKGGGERKIFFSDRAVEWLGRYLDERCDRSDSLFVNSLGEPLTVNAAKHLLLKIRKRFSFGKKIKFHTFRRTLATTLFEKGLDVKDIQSVLGHRSVRTSLKYYIRFNEKKAKLRYQKTMNNEV